MQQLAQDHQARRAGAIDRQRVLRGGAAGGARGQAAEELLDGVDAQPATCGIGVARQRVQRRVARGQPRGGAQVRAHVHHDVFNRLDRVLDLQRRRRIAVQAQRGGADGQRQVSSILCPWCLLDERDALLNQKQPQRRGSAHAALRAQSHT